MEKEAEMYVLRVEVYTKVGHGHEVQSALEEWVRGRQGKQPSFMLTRRVLSSEGFALAVTSRYRDLAEYEQVARKVEADSAFHSALGKIEGLIEGPIRYELYEVVVPFAE
jgi:hypothetical protein